MFTGIIQAIGSIIEIKLNASDNRIVFNTGNMELDDIKIGDSISVNGVCLSIVEKTKDSFSSDLSNETLKTTTFSEMKLSSKVNLEKAMVYTSPINGHIISGHVDGVGIVKNMENDGLSISISVEFPEELEKYITKKGSISVDGISLTINKIERNIFTVNIIPHTLKETIVSQYNVGTKVNVEVDLIARYLEKLVVK